MQMIPELAIAMLACARIGVVHSIVFGLFLLILYETGLMILNVKQLLLKILVSEGKKMISL